MNWRYNMRRWIRGANTRLGGLPLGCFRPRRRFHAFCVGAMKSGTHSISDIFQMHYWAAHEPEGARMIRAIPGAGGGAGPEAVSRFLTARDRRLWLEMDSSHLNSFFIEDLVRTFPRAKFILTIRECRDWLDSVINQQLGRGPVNADWQRMRDLRFRTGGDRHPEAERALAERGLYTLDGYLASWAEHNRRVLAAVPKDRLLVVRTDAIRRSLRDIAAFLGIPAGTLVSARAHSYQAAGKFDVLSGIDPDYLAGKVREHCGPMMDEFFPELAGNPAPHPAGAAAGGSGRR